MSEPRDFERRLSDWLDDEGPQGVPERTLDSAITNASAASRQRPLPGFVLSAIDGVDSLAVARGVPVARVWLMVGLLATLLVGLTLAAGALLLTVDARANQGLIALGADGDIWIIDPEGVQETRNLTATIGLEETGPMWSPDGSRIAYWVTDPSSDTAEIHVRQWPVGTTIRLADIEAADLTLGGDVVGWSPDGRRLIAPAFGVSADGTEFGIDIVVLFDVDTGTASKVPVVGHAQSFGWSPDGAYVGLLVDGRIRLYDTESGQIRSLEVGPNESSDAPQFLDPIFSPDSDAVIFAIADEWRGAGEIRSVRIDGGPGDISILGATNDLGPAVPATDDRFAFGRSRALSVGAAYSDSGDVANISSEIIVLSLNDGTQSTVARDVSPIASWSQDGRRLATTSPDSSELIVVDPERPAQATRFPAPAGTIDSYSWGPAP